MVTDTLILIRVKSTGAEYAYPASRYSELPTVRVDGGAPGHTNFSRSELIFMEEHGSAIRIGHAKMALDINYETPKTSDRPDSPHITAALPQE